MKTRFFLVVIIFLQINFSNAQGVINGDFESWKNKIFFEDPALMSTGNIEMMVHGLTPLAIKSTDAASGNYSIRLNSMKTLNDTAFGYFIYGQPDGQNFNGGTPYTAKPDSLKMMVKYETGGSSDILILLIFKKNGIPVFTQQYSLNGIQTTWKEVAFPVQLMVNPDTMIFGVASCNPVLNTYDPSNWIMVDKVNFTGVAQQLPNNDFETWNTFQNDEPEYWNTFNLYYIINNKQPNVTRSSDAHSGNSSISVKTAPISLFGSKYDTLGIATTGTFTENGYTGGFSMHSKPDSMTFYYKYNNSALITDMAVVYAQFSKFSGNKTTIVDSGFALLPASYIWKKVLVKFDTSSQKPDTCNIVLASSALIFGPGGVGNQLLIDDILFYYKGVGIPLEQISQNDVLVFPNPTSDFVNILCNPKIIDKSVRITSLDGKNILFNQDFHDTELITLDISNYSSGLYVINILFGNRVFTTQIIKK